MTALADELAGERGMYPMTDETLEHIVMGGWTVGRLAQALLKEPNLASGAPRPREIESVAAYMALQTVLPKDPDQLPVERILKFREKYPKERVAFQHFIASMLEKDLWLQNIKHSDVLQE